MSSTSQVLLPGQPLSLPAAASSSTASVQPQAGAYRRSEYIVSSVIGSPSFSRKARQSGRSGSNQSDNNISASVNTPLAPLLRLPEPDSVVLARVTRIASRQATCSILLVLPPTATSSSMLGESSGGSAKNSLSLSQALASGAANHAAGEDPSGLDFSGVIRQQDVRLTETDKVKIAECFRVGDLVKAKVVSLGDSRSYFLTTASNELGVIFATAARSSDVLPNSAASGSFLPSALLDNKSKARQGAAGQRQPLANDQPRVTSVPGALSPLDWQTMVDPETGKTEKRKVAKPEGL
ncbi:unnamed protein product [Parajaminaea phylloscopi]